MTSLFNDIRDKIAHRCKLLSMLLSTEARLPYLMIALPNRRSITFSNLMLFLSASIWP